VPSGAAEEAFSSPIEGRSSWRDVCGTNGVPAPGGAEGIGFLQPRDELLHSPADQNRSSLLVAIEVEPLCVLRFVASLEMRL